MGLGLSSRRTFTPTSEVVAAMRSADPAARGDAGSRTAETVVYETMDDGGRWSTRRWEAADTNRLNANQWATARDVPVNEDLSGRLETLRARCEYEAANNPMVAGAIGTHQVDVVGEHGPTLQVTIDDPTWSEAEKKAYAEALERVWRDWYAMPDAAGIRSGAEMCRQWVRNMDWTKGEFFEQFVTVKEPDQPITLRCLGINPRRVRTPYDKLNSPNVVMGVERNKLGRPLRYHVEVAQSYGDYTTYGPQTEPVPADMMLHGFVPLEPDQARGIPGLSVALQPIADCRQFDIFVLDAARQCASTGVVLWTQHPDSPFILVNEEAELERNTQSTAPPGWQPMQIQPGQPAANYVEYRKERQIEIGRHVSMPLLAIRADASNHNFSSAHFDSQSYGRANRIRQQRLSQYLGRLLKEVQREARMLALSGDRRVPGILAKSPQRMVVVFTGWPSRPHVDPNKVRNANATGLGTLQLSLSDVLAGDGKELDDHLAQLKREFTAMAGIEILPGLSVLDIFLMSHQPPNQLIDQITGVASDSGDDDDEDEPEKPETDKDRSFAHA